MLHALLGLAVVINVVGWPIVMGAALWDRLGHPPRWVSEWWPPLGVVWIIDLFVLLFLAGVVKP